MNMAPVGPSCLEIQFAILKVYIYSDKLFLSSDVATQIP